MRLSSTKQHQEFRQPLVCDQDQLRAAFPLSPLVNLQVENAPSGCRKTRQRLLSCTSRLLATIKGNLQGDKKLTCHLGCVAATLATAWRTSGLFAASRSCTRSSLVFTHQANAPRPMYGASASRPACARLLLTTSPRRNRTSARPETDSFLVVRDTDSSRSEPFFFLALTLHLFTCSLPNSLALLLSSSAVAS